MGVENENRSHDEYAAGWPLRMARQSFSGIGELNAQFILNAALEFPDAVDAEEVIQLDAQFGAICGDEMQFHVFKRRLGVGRVFVGIGVRRHQFQSVQAAKVFGDEGADFVDALLVAEDVFLAAFQFLLALLGYIDLGGGGAGGGESLGFLEFRQDLGGVPAGVDGGGVI